MSSSNFVKREAARHNKEIEEKKRLTSPKTLGYNSGKGENDGQITSSSPRKESVRSLAAKLQYPPRPEEPHPKPNVLPRPSFKKDSSQSRKKPSQDGVINVSKNQIPSLPSLSADLPPRPLIPFTSPELPPPPDFATQEDNDSNVVNNKTSPLPGSNLPPRPPRHPLPPLSSPELPPPPDLAIQEDKFGNNKTSLAVPSNLPPRPLQRPPPPPCTPPPPPPSAIKPHLTEKQPSVRKEAKSPPIIHRSSINHVSDERPDVLTLTSEPKSPKGSNFNAEENGDYSDEYATLDDEKDPVPSGFQSTKSYPRFKTEEHQEVSSLQLEIDDLDDDWDGDASGGECKQSDSEGEPEVEIRHKRDSHGLVTNTLNDVISISVAMKYVSGFFDLPVKDEIYQEISGDAHSTPPELDEGIQKILWKDLPVVKSNPTYKKMNAHKRKLHETIFEIMTTEALYISLLNSFEDQKSYFPTEEVMANSDRDMLFSRLLLVKQCAESFYEELEGCWQQSIFLHGIFDAIEKHATNNFGAYVKYCTNQAHINKMFTKAQKSSGVLSPQLKAYQSFLMLPMLRITRLPSLMESILQQMSDIDEEYAACKRALAAVRKKATECNEDAQSGDRMSGLLELSSHIVFPDEMTPFPLISASRWLKKRTQATLRWRQNEEDSKSTAKEDLEMFLFNDVFFICSRRRRDETYLVQSYCRQSLVEMTHVNGEFLPSLPSRYATDRPGKHVFVVDILSNQDGEREIMVMSTRNQQERDSWLQAAPPPPIPDPSSDICYEPWDCPIVVALLPFEAATPYQLSLALNDKLHVTKRKTIGWYEGERQSDRKTGFFPVNFTMELDSPHKRAREIRERFYPVN